MALDDVRLAALKARKLAALIAATSAKETFGSDLVRPAADSAIVGAVVGSRVYALADEVNDLGAIVRWAVSQSASAVTVFVDDAEVAGHMARRARLLTADIAVKTVVGADAVDSVALPVAVPPVLGDDMWRAAAVMADAGARVVDDHGRLTGEVHGLEVARVEVADAYADSDTGPRLRVGVGEADRELQFQVHGHLSDEQRLRRAVQLVTHHRRPGVALHPLTRLSRPRWLRSTLLADPGLIGLAELEPRPPLQPKPGIHDGDAAAGYSPSDRVTVVCSAGVDLDLLPAAADYRQRIDPASHLIVVVPTRDAALVAGGMPGLVERCHISPIEPPWESVVS